MPEHLNYKIRSVQDEAGADVASPAEYEALIAAAADAGQLPQQPYANRVEVVGPPLKVADLIVRKPDRNPEAIFYFEPATPELGACPPPSNED